MKVIHTDVLGTDYEVNVGKRKELSLPRHLAGQCAPFLQKILVEHSMRKCGTEKERDGRTTEVVAHEIFHAYVRESGLDLDEDVEETLAIWYEKMWRKMNNSICGVLDELGLLDS